MPNYLKVIALSTQETEKVCLWALLLETNQAKQFLKCTISSTPHMHIHDFSQCATTIGWAMHYHRMNIIMYGNKRLTKT